MHSASPLLFPQNSWNGFWHADLSITYIILNILTSLTISSSAIVDSAMSVTTSGVGDDSVVKIKKKLAYLI